MAKRKRKPIPPDPPKLTLKQILAWADAYHERMGDWPRVYSGLVKESVPENWRKIDNALRYGLRGLPGRSSLPKLLARYRGTRNPKALPPLSEDQILAWADKHNSLRQEWPSLKTGTILGAREETWENVDAALREGFRGLPGGSSLARLLEAHRGIPNRLNAPRFTQTQILQWADAYFDRTGKWPNRESGSILEASGETWKRVDYALAKGCRGLPGGTSIPQLLAENRGVHNLASLGPRPPLTVARILSWAKSHKQETGQWPLSHGGALLDAPGETWANINLALYHGYRGLQRGQSLAGLLHRFCGRERGGR